MCIFRPRQVTFDPLFVVMNVETVHIAPDSIRVDVRKREWGNYMVRIKHFTRNKTDFVTVLCHTPSLILLLLQK